MTLRTWFTKQVFIRLTEDHTAFICTTKWPLLSIIRRVGVDGTGRDFAPQSEKRLGSPSRRVREAISRV
jgi:hypothetical protein